MSKRPRPADVARLVKAIDAIAPFHLAEEWDNVGLQAGDPNAAVRCVLVALEATPAVVDEAEAVGADALVTHHPLIFKPLASLAETKPETRVLARLVRSRSALIAAHTNLDAVPEGTSGEMAGRLRLVGTEILFPAPNRAESVKFAVFVPQSHVEAVIDAVASAGAGVIGNYSHCTFRTPGTGTFKALDGADPHVGKIGALTEASDEVRLEAVCPRARLAALVSAVRAAHPYEEMAWDAFALEPSPEPRVGFGLAGALPKEQTLKAFASLCKKAFGVKSVGVVGDEARVVKRAAVFSGSGGEAARRWRASLADVLVTGEMTHHQCAELRDRGGAAVLIGHHASEAIVCPRLARMLAASPLLEGCDVQFLVARRDFAPATRL